MPLVWVWVVFNNILYNAYIANTYVLLSIN